MSKRAAESDASGRTAISAMQLATLQGGLGFDGSTLEDTKVDAEDSKVTVPQQTCAESTASAGFVDTKAAAAGLQSGAGAFAYNSQPRYPSYDGFGQSNGYCESVASIASMVPAPYQQMGAYMGPSFVPSVASGYGVGYGQQGYAAVGCGGGGYLGGFGDVRRRSVDSDAGSVMSAAMTEHFAKKAGELRALKSVGVIDTRLLREMKWSLADLSTELELLVKVCLDKTGSRYLQSLIESPHSEVFDIATFVGALLRCGTECVLRLCCDEFANWVIQKVMEVCCENREMHLFFDEERATSLERIGDSLLSLLFESGLVAKLSTNPCGSRVVQRVLKYRHSHYGRFKESILASIWRNEDTLHEVMQHPFGNHVLQLCIEQLDGLSLSHLCAAIANSQHSYAYYVHVYGCRVVQKLMSHCTHTQMYPVFLQCTAKCLDLCKDPYGNYVIQRILALHLEALRRQKTKHSTTAGLIGFGECRCVATIVTCMCDNIRALCCNKYASNVIEDCIKACPLDLKCCLIDAIVPCVVPLIKHEYGNYVLQCVLELCTEDESVYERYALRLRDAITKQMTRAEVVKLCWGKYLLRKLEPILVEVPTRRRGIARERRRRYH